MRDCSYLNTYDFICMDIKISLTVQKKGKNEIKQLSV
tara:strand:- start:490 stop:600 length:111 start_codon:yes stop_codon:yes gene_type:complete